MCIFYTVLWSQKYFFRLRRQFQTLLRIVLYDTLKITFFDLSNWIKTVTIYKNIFSNHDFFYKFLYKFLKGAGAAVRYFDSGSGRQFNFSSSAPAPQH
jgi:hypothetical protein